MTSDQNSADGLAQSFDHSLVMISLWVKIGHRNSTATSDGNVQKLGHANIAKISGMILNWSQPKFAAKLVANEM